VVECVNNRNILTAYPSFNTPDKINARIESQVRAHLVNLKIKFCLPACTISLISNYQDLI
jgi:hypothetical protein